MRLSQDRQVASELLLRQETQPGGRLDVWLRQECEGLSDGERRRVQALVYGINRNRTALGRWFERFLKKPLVEQAPEVRVALLLGTYEILHQDSVPDRAAVHQAVQLVRERGGERRTGLVNAVLRRVGRGERAAPVVDRSTEPLKWAQFEASHPRWLVEEMAARVPADEVADWAEANNREPTLAVRLADPADDAAVAALGGERCPEVPGAVRLVDRPSGPISAFPGFAEGRWWVQDLAAQAVVEMMGLQPGMRVLDVCSAPGGKTLAAACAVGPTGSVVALDRSAKRLRLVDEGVQRLGLENVTVQARDLLSTPWDGDRFDVVLVDAPCTGLGVLRRHPEIRWSRQRRDCLQQSARQVALLDGAADALAPGGALIYSVCTFSEPETDGVLEELVAARPDLRPVDPRRAAPHLGEGMLDGDVLRTYPHRHDADGFYAVRLEHTA